MTYIDGSKPIEVRDYYVEVKDVTWDGASPLKLDVIKIVEAAREYAFEQYKRKVDFQSLQLTSDDDDPKARRYHWLKLSFGTTGRNARAIEIFADLRGRVIRPVIHKFKTSKEYGLYAKQQGLLVNIPHRW